MLECYGEILITKYIVALNLKISCLKNIKNQHMNLTEWDVALFYLVSKNVFKGIDYRTSTYLAFHQLIGNPLPKIFPVNNKNYSHLCRTQATQQ